ncbi:MAG: hypothetical protein OXC10_12185 [Rhodospirillaceae bacterium]|nr:hypothetical protein [Rhodospirillaceae bacterium]
MPDSAAADGGAALTGAPPALPEWIRIVPSGGLARVVGRYSTGALVVEDSIGQVWIVEAEQYEPVGRSALA